MMTVKHLITHALLTMKSSEDIKASTSTIKEFGHIDLFMGPGDEFAFLNISIMYDMDQKIQFVQWKDGTSTISKSLFDRDLAPKCHEVIGRIKTELGKMEYDTIYLVKESKVEKVRP